MALRKGHGTGKGVPRVETLPPDEMPEPVVVPQEPLVTTRHSNGHIADSETAKRLGRLGGIAKEQKKRLLQGMGLAKLTDDKAFTPYYRAGQAWLDATVQIYANMCGGALGPGPSAMLGNAAIALAYSRYLADKAFNEGDETIARQALRYMDAIKQQSLAAYELGVREAKMRLALNESTGLDAFETALLEQKASAENGSSK